MVNKLAPFHLDEVNSNSMIELFHSVILSRDGQSFIKWSENGASHSLWIHAIFNSHSPRSLIKFSYASCLRIISTIYLWQRAMGQPLRYWLLLHAVDLNWISIKLMDFCCVLFCFSWSRFNAKSIAFQRRSCNEAHTTIQTSFYFKFNHTINLRLLHSND